jgi:acetyltransferase-like isoleucine patch superfamily enzyme
LPFRRIFQRLNRIYAIRSGVYVEQDVHIGIGTILWAPDSLRISENVYIGKYCTIQCNGEIGKGVLIGNNVGVIGRNDHDYKQIGVPIRNADWVGSNNALSQNNTNRVVIEDDVWIGYGAIILSGLKINRGAVVAAGSVVTKDVASYSIVGGNPARILGMRFEGANDIVDHENSLKMYYEQAMQK